MMGFGGTVKEFIATLTWPFRGRSQFNSLETDHIAFSVNRLHTEKDMKRAHEEQCDYVARPRSSDAEGGETLTSGPCDKGRIRLGVPCKLPFYRPLNGYHPLIASFLEANPRVKTTFYSQSQIRPQRFVENCLAEELARQTCGLAPEQSELLVKWVDFADQVDIEAQARDAETIFLHTAPIYIGSKNWILHFESFITLFMPFLLHGASKGIDLQSERYFELRRSQLESARCLAIFSHMRESLDIVDRVFQSQTISEKLFYVPLGIKPANSEMALAKFDEITSLRILFTNSHHQNPASFYLRGGHHLLRAFFQLRRTMPGVELTILSSIPDDMTRRFATEELAGVNWIAEPVDDRELEQLLLSHHIFALPSCGLHSYSFLRAIAYGCVPIISDAPGFDELSQGLDDSIMVVRGIQDLVYQREPAGWLSDFYHPFTVAAPQFSNQIYELLVRNYDMATLKDFARKNVDHCAANFSVEKSVQAFERLLDFQLGARHSYNPVLAEEGYKGYNIVDYLYKFWGIPQEFGPMNIALQSDREREGVLVADDMDGIHAAIDDAACARG